MLTFHSLIINFAECVTFQIHIFWGQKMQSLQWIILNCTILRQFLSFLWLQHYYEQIFNLIKRHFYTFKYRPIYAEVYFFIHIFCYLIQIWYFSLNIPPSLGQYTCIVTYINYISRQIIQGILQTLWQCKNDDCVFKFHTD